MKELITKDFWLDLKRTFEEAQQEPNAPPAALRGVLFDMDGVLYDADRPIAGAADAVGWLRVEGIPHLFVTNTTSRSRKDLVQKLAGFAIDAAESDILTPTAIAADWLRTDAKGAAALFVRPAARQEFADVPLVSEDAEQGAAYVVIGDLGDLWDYRTLNRAFRLLHNNPEAKLIALGMTRYWMAADGISLDVAPFVVALSHASGQKPMVFGKPGAAFFRAAAQQLNLTPGQLLMIGDDIEADVRGAQAAGLSAILVKTGKYRAADLERGVPPPAVLDSVADLPRWWKEPRP